MVEHEHTVQFDGSVPKCFELFDFYLKKAKYRIKMLESVHKDVKKKKNQCIANIVQRKCLVMGKRY